MIDNIYQNNLKKLREKYPSWAKQIEKSAEEDDKADIDVGIEYSIDEKAILTVYKDGKKYYLEGKYAPERIADRWLDKNKDISEFSTIFIIGIHNGMHIRKIMESVPEKTNIIIYEPCCEVFRTAFENVDLSFLFEPDIPVGVIVEGINENDLLDFFSVMINFDNMTLLKIYMSENYGLLFADKVEEIIKSLKKHINDITISWNTTVRYTSVNATNVFNNIVYFYNNYTINSLHKILPKGMPAIVVSAGPSLNKNIMELKKAKNRACIIATDTALKPLLNAGIRPDLFVVVDGLKPGKLFEHEDLSKIPMVTYTTVAVEPMKMHKGKKFFSSSNTALEAEMIRRMVEYDSYEKDFAFLPTGGSVANNAFTLGMYMGADTIILVGQDLAFTNNRTHADGTFKDKMDPIDINSTEYFEVEANDGGKILTRADFNHYRKWFEDRIVEWPHIKVINATEGGAKINGAEVMTLKQAIEEKCNVEKNVSWMISRRKKYLQTDGERQQLLKYFLDCPDKILEVEKKAEKGIDYYKKLLALSKKKTYSEQQLRKILKKIKNVNDYMEKDYMALMIGESLRGIEYTLRANIFQVKETEKDEIQDIAQQGMLMLESMIYAGKQFEILADNTVVKFAKKKEASNCNDK